MHQTRREWLISAVVASATAFLSSADSRATFAKSDPNVTAINVKTKHKPSESTWKEHPARTVAMLSGIAPEPEMDHWGGRTDRKADATGFFHVKKINERWWLVDPDGGLFLHVGVVSLGPGGSAASQSLLASKFGTREKWAETTTQLLRGLGFNGAGAWSDTGTLRSVKPVEPLIYTVMGNGSAASGGFMSNFGKRLKVTRSGVGHTAYRGDCLPIFHPEFAGYCDEYARRIAANATDPYLLGYFSDNELPMPSLDNYLKLSPNDPAMGSSYQAAQDWLDARKGKSGATIADAGEADRDAWVEYAYDRYLSLTTAATRKYDPHHLCLGPRFYGKEKRYQGTWRAAGRHLDAIAINHYGVWDPDDGVVQFALWSGKPVMISEFYAKGADSGFANTGGAGWLVPTQADRGLFYETFALGLLQSKACIGWHWFKYQDNDPTDTKADASNVDSNKGIVDSQYAPYSPLVDHMRKLNTRVYALADYFDRK